MSQTCSQCGGPLAVGYVRATGLSDSGTMEVSETGQAIAGWSGMEFVLPGTPTSRNLFKAFLQGMKEDQLDKAFPITGFRCQQCGRVEFYALNEAEPE